MFLNICIFTTLIYEKLQYRPPSEEVIKTVLKTEYNFRKYSKVDKMLPVCEELSDMTLVSKDSKQKCPYFNSGF